MRLAAVLALALVAGCQPTVAAPRQDAQPPPDPDCVTACAHASSLGCAEGRRPECASTCTAMQGSVVGRAVDWACVERADSVDAARACGVRFCGGS